jgi:hypothetical protein
MRWKAWKECNPMDTRHGYLSFVRKGKVGLPLVG